MHTSPREKAGHPERPQLFIIDPKSEPELTPEEAVPPEERPLYIEESEGDCDYRKNTTAWD